MRTANALRSSPPWDSDPQLVDSFKAYVESKAFPCVGGKSALNRGQIEFVLEDDLRNGPRPETLAAIQAFSSRYTSDAELFRSLVVLFRNPVRTTELAFEQDLWAYLQRLHELDRSRYPWDPRVSSDPDAPDFSFSLGGRAYYVVGLHPGASRTARRFSHAALVFNLHDQFERLRADGRYDAIRDAIVRRDQQIEGTKNPMLKEFGKRSEACQYSGRVVPDSWKCPFHAH